MINEFGKKRVAKNIGRLTIALFKANDVDLALTYVLAKSEIDRRKVSQTLIDEITNLITKQSK